MESNEQNGGEVEVMESQESASADPASGDDTDPYEAAANSPAIKEAFARVFGKGADADESPSEEDGEVEETTPDAAVADEEGSEEDDAPPVPAPKAKPAVKIASPADQEATATLPPALKQAALRAKWDETAINEFYEANPELATRTFENLQASHNELSRRFAQLGVQRVQPGQQPAQQQQPGQPASKLDALYAKLEEFGRNNGTDLTEQLIKPLFDEVVAPFRAMQAAYQQQQTQQMAFQVHQTFDGFKEFADVYGGSAKGMTPEHAQARFQVATLADRIRAGASLQGVDMPVGEALQMAHDLFTQDRKTSMARQQVEQKVVKRATRITARPTQRRVPATANEGARKSEASAAAAIDAFWRERGVNAE